MSYFSEYFGNYDSQGRMGSTVEKNWSICTGIGREKDLASYRVTPVRLFVTRLAGLRKPKAWIARKWKGSAT